MSEFEHIQPALVMEYCASRPTLLFGSDPLRRAAKGALIASGVRLVDSLPLDQALARLNKQASLELAWLELGEDDVSPTLDRLLVKLNGLAETRGTIVIAAVPLSLVDLVAANLTARTSEILVEPDEVQRTAILALALAKARDHECAREAGKENALRLKQLSDEMARIASALTHLSTERTVAVSQTRSQRPAPRVDAETVEALIRARRLRFRFFPHEIFADPAWDMMLDLLRAEIAQLRVSVSSLCIAAEVPTTTALRWIRAMTEQGMLVRTADPRDGRRIFVTLAPATSEALRRYFRDLRKIVVKS